MLTFALFLIVLGNDLPWRINDTEIYKPLEQGQVTQSPEYGWFLLDTAGQRILNYDGSGAFVRVVAKAGQGPSELNQVQYIAVDDGFLYAVSLYRIKVFKATGAFVKQIKRSDYHYWLEKVPGGWLAYPHPLDMRSDQELVLFDNQLAHPHILTKWVQRVIKKSGSLPYRPDIFCFVLDSARERVFLRKPGTDVVELWDLNSRKLQKTLGLGVHLDPDARFQVILAEAKKNGTGLKMNTWYPDMKMGPAGSLYFYPIRSKSNAIVFDPQGQPSVSRHPRSTLERILRVQEERIYFSWIDQDAESFGVRRAPHDLFSKHVEANPIDTP